MKKSVVFLMIVPLFSSMKASYPFAPVFIPYSWPPMAAIPTPSQNSFFVWPSAPQNTSSVDNLADVRRLLAWAEEKVIREENEARQARRAAATGAATLLAAASQLEMSTNSDQEVQEMIVCPHCKKRFEIPHNKSLRRFDMHQQRCRERPKPREVPGTAENPAPLFRCPVPECQELFNTPLGCNTHYGRIHLDRPHICGINGCNSKFLTRRRLEKHRQDVSHR